MYLLAEIPDNYGWMLVNARIDFSFHFLVCLGKSTIYNDYPENNDDI